MLQATQRVVPAQMVMPIKHRNRRVATLSLLDFTMLMVLLKNVLQVIFVKVKPPIKPHAYPDLTPPTKDPLHALNAHLGRMPARLAPLIAKLVIRIPTNPTPMLRNAFQCKKGSTNRVQQPKSNARRVNQDVVATQRAKIAGKEHFKAKQVKPLATTAQADGAIPATDRPAATPCHQGRTH